MSKIKVYSTYHRIKGHAEALGYEVVHEVFSQRSESIYLYLAFGFDGDTGQWDIMAKVRISNHPMVPAYIFKMGKPDIEIGAYKGDRVLIPEQAVTVLERLREQPKIHKVIKWVLAEGDNNLLRLTQIRMQALEYENKFSMDVYGLAPTWQTIHHVRERLEDLLEEHKGDLAAATKAEIENMRKGK